MGYYSIHNHSSFSNALLGFADSINDIKQSVDYALDLGLSGYVLTDHEGLSGHAQLMHYRDKLEKEGRIDHESFTIGFGDEIYLVEDLEMGQKYYHHLLIAKDKKGHKILRMLSSKAWKNSYWDRGLQRTPITREQVKEIMEQENGKGHIVSSTACLGSFEAQAFLKIKAAEEVPFGEKINQEKILEEKQKIVDFVLWNQEVFGEEDFYLEIAPNTSEEQRYVNRRVWKLGKAMNVPVVFSTDSHYLTEADREIHKAYLNSKQAEREVDDFYYTAYMMPPEQVKEYFLLDFSEEEFQEMLDNLEKIRSGIKHYSLFKEQEIPYVPVDVPELSKTYNNIDLSKYKYLTMLLNSDEDQDLYWSRTCLNQLEIRNVLNERYLEQLEIEATTLVKISERLKQPMTSYYNTAQKIIELIWDEGDSLVGVSRGSAMGFMSNWLLDVTQVDPIPYVGDMSWRHLAESRPELPDVDIDSQGSKREQILLALKNFFGHDRVLNIATFGTEKAKSALATAARGLGISDDVSSYLSGLIPNERGFDWNLKDMVYGNPEKGRKPVSEFINEINKYENYLETALAIEGMVKSRGSHASGVYIFNHPYTDINAMMKTPNDLEVTQWDYHDSDDMGALKMDMLSIEALDKIRQTMDLLIKDNRMEWKGSLKETYFNTLHPDVLDYSKELWEPTWDNKVLDIFQLDTPVGKEAVRKGKPEDVKDAAALNSLMRLMATENGEMPLEKYARFKENIQLWYEELEKYNIPADEIPILEKHFLSSYGVPNTQEELMLILMDENICNFTETEANAARKIIGKKLMDKIPELRAKIFEQAVCSSETVHYIWDSAVSVQMGYSFSILHTIGYTIIALQELNLFNHYPSIYWNCGCLIVNSGDETGTSTDYSKMAVALGNTIKHGIKVEMVDINKSESNFSPNVEGNFISYGLRPLTGIGYEFIQKIFEGRPFSSLADFVRKTNPNKMQMLTLIKAGAFREIDSSDRKITLAKYAKMMTGLRKNLTMTQVPLVMKINRFPESLQEEKRIYEFNRYVNEVLTKSGQIIRLDDRAQNFLSSIGLDEFIETFSDEDRYWTVMSRDRWSKFYDKKMDTVRNWLRENKESLLEEIFFDEMLELFDSYGGHDSYARWEMESMNFYYTEHELNCVDVDRYGIDNFELLPREAQKINPYASFSKLKLNRIVGTIIGKNKVKASIDVLTPEGTVVLVKMYKGDFSYWDKQISERTSTGKKTVVEKSFFDRGNKLFITGFRRDDQFIPRAYNDTATPKIGLITETHDDGSIVLKTERAA